MKRFLLIGLIAGILLSGCNSTSISTGPVPIRMAVIPVIDTLPIFVAESEGLFKKHNLEVELIPVASAPERDQIIQAGKADGALNETLAVMLFNQQKVQIQAVRYGLMASQGAGHFFILASLKIGFSSSSQG